MPHLRSVPLFVGAHAAVTDVRCRAPGTGRGREEHASGHQIIFIRRGVFIRHAGGSEVMAEPLQALVFNADAPFRVSHPDGCGDDCTVLVFPRASIVDVLGAYEPGAADRGDAPFTLEHAPVASRTVLRLQRVRADLSRGMATALQAEEEALRLLGEVTEFERGLRRPRQLKAAVRARTRAERVQIVKHLIAADPAAVHTLAGLGAVVEWSPFTLTRAFRAETGYPVHQYILRLRLSLSLDYLVDRTANLSALALDLGFASHSHFTTAFCRVFRVSPSAFRAESAGKGQRAGLLRPSVPSTRAG